MSLSQKRIMFSVFVAASISYVLFKLSNLSWLQIVMVGGGVALFLVFYGQVTYRWYSQKISRVRGVMSRRIHLSLIMLIGAVLILVISGGIQDTQQVIDGLFVLLVVGILGILISRLPWT